MLQYGLINNVQDYSSTIFVIITSFWLVMAQYLRSIV